MKKTNLIFWVVTIIFAAFMLFSAAGEIMNTADAKAVTNQLGYPSYFNLFLGVLKVLGAVAIIIPGFPKIAEWAYAGFFFDLLAATYSQIAIEGFKPEIAFMLIFFLVWGVSYVYYHKRLSTPAVQPK
ncbi:MAG TPA: DoxX family protein [Puia sp.]|nr:DoxX family protein [Puia sp.]